MWDKKKSLWRSAMLIINESRSCILVMIVILSFFNELLLQNNYPYPNNGGSHVSSQQVTSLNAKYLSRLSLMLPWLLSSSISRHLRIMRALKKFCFNKKWDYYNNIPGCQLPWKYPMSLLPSSNGTALIEVPELNFKKIYRPGKNRAKFFCKVYSMYY